MQCVALARCNVLELVLLLMFSVFVLRGWTRVVLSTHVHILSCCDMFVCKCGWNRHWCVGVEHIPIWVV